MYAICEHYKTCKEKSCYRNRTLKYFNPESFSPKYRYCIFKSILFNCIVYTDFQWKMYHAVYHKMEVVLTLP